MSALTPEETIKVFGKTQQELIALVDKHTLSVQRWLSSRSPQAVTFQGKGVRASSTGLKIPLLNLALGFDFPPDASNKDIDDEIEVVKKFFVKRNIPWYWWIGTSPHSTSANRILEKHGLRLDYLPLPAMAASLTEDNREYPTYGEHIHIWPAETMEDLKAASMIRRIAFRFPEGEALSYFEDMASDWLENPSVELFLAGEKRSEPVSIGAVIYAEGISGIYVMATLPEHHRKGFGKAVLTKLMSEVKAEGYSIAALTASKAGFGLYSQFGFHHIFDYDIYSLST